MRVNRSKEDLYSQRGQKAEQESRVIRGEVSVSDCLCTSVCPPSVLISHIYLVCVTAMEKTFQNLFLKRGPHAGPRLRLWKKQSWTSTPSLTRRPMFHRSQAMNSVGGPQPVAETMNSWNVTNHLLYLFMFSQTLSVL